MLGNATTLSTALTTLISAIFGLAAGLGGVVLQATLQRKERVADRAFETNKVLREKAEAIYVELEEARERAAKSAFKALTDLNGVTEADFTRNADLETGRLKALVQMYFPAIVPEISGWDKKVYELVKEFGSQFSLVEQDAALSAVEKVAKVKELRLAHAKAMNSVAIEWVAKIRHRMNQEVMYLI